MEILTLEEIESFARARSVEMQHYYVGVEHLFLALLTLEGGLAAAVLRHVGQSVEQVQQTIVKITGHGDQSGYWSGTRSTPRAQVVLDEATRLIGAGKPAENALLWAILREGQNVPVRALREIGLEPKRLLQELNAWTEPTQGQPPLVVIEGEADLTMAQQAILQTMFRKYARIRIEHVFTGFSGAGVVLVRPIHADNRVDALTIVKFDDRQAIRWEKRRYDDYVRDRLPPRTARIETDPVFTDKANLGALRYTFIRSASGALPVSLTEYALTHSAEEVSAFLRDKLFEGFRETWWGQTRPYLFPAWHEYELMMPPAFTLEAVAPTKAPATMRTLHPMGEWSHTRDLLPGEYVGLENFTVLKVKRDEGIVQLCAGNAPEAVYHTGRVEVQGLNLRERTYVRGEPMPRVVGKIASTRDMTLQARAWTLEAPFNLDAELIPVPSWIWHSAPELLPNPLMAYISILGRPITGMLSTIHGDLHTGNVLIGPGGDAWLIDFEWARDGHTLFDWAVLEVSLLLDYISHFIESGWDGVWRATGYMAALNNGWPVDTNDPLGYAFSVIGAVRSIIGTIIDKENPFNIRDERMLRMSRQTMWASYHVALSLAALRAANWINRPVDARRLQLLVSALSMDYVARRSTVEGAGQTQGGTGSTDPRATPSMGTDIRGA